MGYIKCEECCNYSEDIDHKITHAGVKRKLCLDCVDTMEEFESKVRDEEVMQKYIINK